MSFRTNVENLYDAVNSGANIEIEYQGRWIRLTSVEKLDQPLYTLGQRAVYCMNDSINVDIDELFFYRKA